MPFCAQAVPKLCHEAISDHCAPVPVPERARIRISNARQHESRAIRARKAGAELRLSLGQRHYPAMLATFLNPLPALDLPLQSPAPQTVDCNAANADILTR